LEDPINNGQELIDERYGIYDDAASKEDWHPSSDSGIGINLFLSGAPSTAGRFHHQTPPPSILGREVAAAERVTSHKSRGTSDSIAPSRTLAGSRSWRLGEPAVVGPRYEVKNPSKSHRVRLVIVNGGSRMDYPIINSPDFL
jgi:hypothetical protein